MSFPLALFSAFLLLALASQASAVTAPAVSLVDNAGNTILIDGNAVVTYGGSCTPATCTTTSVSVSAGLTSWVGTIGSFSLRTVVGTTKPYSVPNPSQDLNLQHVTTSTGGTLTIQWTDTDFNYSDITAATIAAGGVLSGSGTSTYTAYFDNTNAPFGTGTQVGTLGPFSTSAFNGQVSGPGPTASPFSMMEVVNLSLGPGAVLGVDYEFIPLPAPLSLMCAANAAQVGVPYNSSLMAVGGITPYTFSVTSGTLPPGLVLDASTGAITGTPTTAGTYSFTAQVVDSSEGTASTSTTSSTCTIVVTSPIPITLACPITTGQVSVPYSSALAASGGTPPYTYSIKSGSLPDGLTLNPGTGAITGTPTTAGPFTFTAQVTDSTNSVAGTTTSNCSITINAPPTATCPSVATGEVGVSYNSAMIPSGGAGGPYTFSNANNLPPGLTISSSGVISGTPTTAGTYPFTVTVKDANNVAATVSCTITINPPPSLTCSATNSGEVGAPFSSPALTVTGGTAPYTFSIATGTLPAGLTLNTSTGAITGTPTAAGTFTIQVKDANGVVATGTCPYTIVGGPSLTCSATNSGEVGAPFNSPALTVTGGTAPYTFSIATGSLPDGLTLDSTTGAITGTPTAAGTFTIQVKDANGVVATGTCPYTIAPPPSLTCSVVNSGEVGAPFSSPALTVTGGTAPYTFSVATGTLPAGLTLNTSTGAITGTPTAAGTFTIQVKDANGVVATGTCPYTIAPPPSLTCSAVNTGQVGMPFSSPALTVTGGLAPYTFSVATGTLPAGLTLNTSTGAITGTPTAAGTFTVQVKDANGVVATGTCPYTIAPPPSLTCSAVNTGQVGMPFSSPALTVTGGLAPYTFSVATGTLPAGLTLNTSTGAITGTPTAAGTFTVQVKDANGVVAAGTCPYTVIAPTPLTLICPTATAQLNTAYSSVAVASGGIAPYTFSVATGSLPPGLTLNTSTGAITGTPTAAGTFGFTLQVKDSTGAIALSSCTSACNAAAAWNFNVPSGTLGTSHAYTANGLTITAYGFTKIGSTPIALFGKNDGGDESGLGINGLAEGEIDTAHFVQLDLSSVIASGAQNAQIVIDSVQSGEGYAIYGSNTLGSLGTLLITGALDNTAFNIPNYPNYKYISVIATGGNVLVGAVSFTIPTCNIVVSAPVDLECGTCGANKATVGVTYSSTLAATGGTGPYTYSIVSGSLPSGVTLNASTGVISGIPTTAGTYTFTSKAVDSKGNSDTATCTIVVLAPPIDLECGTCGGGKPTVGKAYSSQLSVNGGTGPFTFSIVSGSLPPGLTLNTSTGVISGTPTTPGTYSFTTKVVDSKGSTDTAYCTVVVVPSPVDLECGSCGSGNASTGAAYSSQLSVSGGTGPYTYSIISGSLPPGLTLGASTGKITGTPTTAGSYTFTSKVVDANGYTDTAVCTIVVQAPPVNLDCGTCGASNGKVGTPYSATYAISGGKAPYTFSIISGSLPPGLTLNSSTGVISGTPMAAGTYTFTAKVVDANGRYDAQVCTIVIAGSALNLNCGTCGASKATVGTTYTVQYSVTGGTGPYTFSIISGSLPPGLTLNSSTGVISGKPTAAGSYTFTAKVVDSRGNSDTQACTVTVTTAPIDLECGSCGTGNGTVGTAYSSQLTVTGGTGPFTYSIISGSLPAGLTLNTSTGVISGTPTTAGTYTFTSKVVDSKGTSDTTTCTIVVVTNAIDLECGSCGAGKATTGAAYSSQLAVNGGTGPFTYSIISGSLPAGLTLNTSTGVISGTPTTAGTYTFTSKVVDSKGKSDTTTCTIVVVAPPINLDCGPCSASKAWAGQSYSATMTTTGGTGHYTYSVISGSLPAGLTLNSSTGTISGTATTPGTYTFTSKVVDSSGNSDTDICTIVVQGSPVNLACGSCGAGNAYQGQGYTSTLKATGGSGSYTYSIVSGSLPQGLTLNGSTGVISGTPTGSGTYTFTSKAVDAHGNFDTTTCTINVEQSYWNWSWH